MQGKLNSQTLSDGTTQMLKRARPVWRTAALMLGVILTCAPTTHALPPGGGGSGDDFPDPIPEACDDVRGTISATPSVIDRNTNASVVSTITWRVTLPAGCRTPLGLTINNQPVGLSGAFSREVTSATTFSLRSRTWSRTFASATVTVSGDPGLITVSPGPSITAEDRAEFNAQWMQPYQKNLALARADGNLYGQNPVIMPEVSERMGAMVRMYDLTHDEQYLKHLQKFIDTALLYRDDHHPGPRLCTPPQCPPPSEIPWWNPLDWFRGQWGMPAWGAHTIITAGLHYVDEISFGYAYPIAAFARIVAEHPDLRSQYGDDAIRYANDIIKTVKVFLPQIVTRQRNGFTEATLITPDIFLTTPTNVQCDGAYARALVAEPGNTYLGGWHNTCRDLDIYAGLDMAHNWNQSYMMGLIELWKALDNPWYRNHPDADPLAGLLRVQLPVLVSRLHRNFTNSLQTVGSGDTARFFWHFNDGVPNPSAEDTSHGALDMRGLEVLRANFARLNAAATAAGEPMVLNETHLRRFANTFLQKVAAGSNLAENIDGIAGDPAALNGLCDGWMNLAIVNVQVYHKCHEVSLRVVNGGQPYLSIGNHSALLMNKRWLPPPTLRLVPDVRGLTVPEASSALVAAGFARGTVSFVTASTCDSIGLVISQNPAAGASLATGTLVKLSVARTSSTICDE
jgi:PASTA domain